MRRPTITVGLSRLLTLACLLTACSGGGDALQRIQSKGVLTVATRNSPTTYFIDRDGPSGFEYALAGLLAEDLGVDLRIETAFTLESLFEKLARGEADLVAAGLALTPDREQQFPHTAAYNRQKAQVVYVTDSSKPDSMANLPGRKLVALAGSGHVGELRRLKEQELPELAWEEVAGADSSALLELLDAGQAELAIIGSNEFEVQRSLYPRLEVAFDLTSVQEQQDMVWYLAPGADNTRLRAYIDQFFLRLEEDGTLANLREQYLQRGEGLTRLDSHAFNSNVRDALPKYRKLIEQVADEYQLDWRLLAAIAYQESHWDPTATSPTGVRGLMMLTKPTAREIGVTDRLDPLQSLRGGSRYLKNLKRRLPKSIYQEDRLWFALAAYNIGLGHLEDARVITERQGGDPNSWQDVVERLPLLQKSSHYKNTRYGYAKGVAAARYVQNIRHYQDILNLQDITDNRPLPPLVMEDYLPEVLRGTELRAL